MDKNVKQTFETLAIAVLCTIWVLSIHQGCSDLSTRFSDKKTETKKVQKIQELKKDTINTFKLEQKVR